MLVKFSVCVVVVALVGAAAALQLPQDVLDAAIQEGFMATAEVHPSSGRLGASSRRSAERDIGARLLQQAAGSGSPWYTTGVSDGPPCPQDLPLHAGITVSDIQDALDTVSSIATAKLSPPGVLTSPPGIHVNVVVGDQVLMSKGFGTTHVDYTGTAPVTGDSIFRIGSNTKPFITLAYHKLVEMGVVGAHDALSTHLPEFVYHDPFANNGPITLHELATFQAGLQREACVAARGQYGCGLLVGNNATAVYDAMQHTSTVFPRNSPTPIYSNLQIQLLGYALDAAIKAKRSSSLPYSGIYDFIDGEIFTPLGFNGTGFNVTDEVAARMAWSGNSTLNNFCRFMNFGFTTPSGGMYMSGNDMGKWVKYLLSATNATGRGQIVEASTLRSFLRVVSPFRGGTSGFGYSTFVAYINGFWATTKGGDVPGYNCAIIVVPELGLGISVLTSSGNFDSSTISVPALNALIPAVQAALESKAAANAERVYCGEYVYSAKDLSFLITASPQGLHLASASDPSVTGTLIPSGSANTFFLVPNSNTSCYLALAEVTAVAGGAVGGDITSTDMIQFVMDNTTGVAVALVQPYTGAELKRQPSRR